MKLYEHLSEKTICMDLKGHSSSEVITELAELLKSNGSVDDFDVFLSAVLTREKQNTTGIGGGIAIPHARTDSVHEFVAALGCSQEGIDFNSTDGRPVHVVIVMGIPTREVKSYLRLLAHMSLMVKQGRFVDDLLAAADATEIISALKGYEE